MSLLFLVNSTRVKEVSRKIKTLKMLSRIPIQAKFYCPSPENKLILGSSQVLAQDSLMFIQIIRRETHINQQHITELKADGSEYTPAPLRACVCVRDNADW